MIPSQAAPTFKQSPSMNSSFTPSRVPVSSASRVPVSTTARSPLSPRVPVSATSRGIPSRDTPSPAVSALIDTLTLDDVDMRTNTRESDSSSVDEQPVAGVRY